MAGAARVRAAAAPAALADLLAGRLIEYPLRAGDVISKVGPAEVLRSAASYAGARLRPRREAETFEQWVTQRFGRRLFELFFRSYTEKVWGVPSSEIRAEWAAQRIRGLSLWRAAAARARDRRRARSAA